MRDIQLKQEYHWRTACKNTVQKKTLHLMVDLNRLEWINTPRWPWLNDLIFLRMRIRKKKIYIYIYISAMDDFLGPPKYFWVPASYNVLKHLEWHPSTFVSDNWRVDAAGCHLRMNNLCIQSSGLSFIWKPQGPLPSALNFSVQQRLTPLMKEAIIKKATLWKRSHSSLFVPFAWAFAISHAHHL